MTITSADIRLLRAAASLAEHAPEKMCAAHLAPRLENLAHRLAAEYASEHQQEDVPQPLPRAA